MLRMSLEEQQVEEAAPSQLRLSPSQTKVGRCMKRKDLKGRAGGFLGVAQDGLGRVHIDVTKVRSMDIVESVDTNDI